MIVLISLLALFIRLYKLDAIPAEIWGDVIEHYKFVEILLKGEWLKNYWCGDGPLFSYFAAFFSKIFGLSFYALKLTSVFINLLLIIAVYFLTKAIFGKRKIADIASFLTAVSFWSLSFSRQAKPYILVPLFVALFLFFLIKKNKFFAGIILGIGMYTQSAFWGMAVFAFSSLTTFLGFVFSGYFFIYQFFFEKNFVFSSSSYLGEKFAGSMNLGATDYIKGLLINFYRNLISFNFVGDSSFRHTIPGRPHLDLLTGVFFLLGWFFLTKLCVKNKQKKPTIFLIIAFFVVQIPSLLDVKNNMSTPNMGRMIGVMPLAYIIAAYGIYQTAKYFKKIIKQKYFISFFCFLIFIINFYQYFYVYPKTLPNKNTPFGKIIAEKIDEYPQSVKVVLLECCWGDWGQPEPNGILFELKNKKIFFHVERVEDLPIILSSLEKEKYVIIAGPNRDLSHLNPIRKKNIEKNDWQIAWLYEFF